jgi:hypothetical protein
MPSADSSNGRLSARPTLHPLGCEVSGTSSVLSVCRPYSHLDRVFLVVVNQVNDPVLLLETINGNNRFAGGGQRGQRFRNRDVVDRFPIPVVHLERWREEWRLFPFPSPALLESSRAALDGLRAQARKACRVEPSSMSASEIEVLAGLDS